MITNNQEQQNNNTQESNKPLDLTNLYLDLKSKGTKDEDILKTFSGILESGQDINISTGKDTDVELVRKAGLKTKEDFNNAVSNVEGLVYNASVFNFYKKENEAYLKEYNGILDTPSMTTIALQLGIDKNTLEYTEPQEHRILQRTSDYGKIGDMVIQDYRTIAAANGIEYSSSYLRDLENATSKEGFSFWLSQRFNFGNDGAPIPAYAYDVDAFGKPILKVYNAKNDLTGKQIAQIYGPPPLTRGIGNDVLKKAYNELFLPGLYNVYGHTMEYFGNLYNVAGYQTSKLEKNIYELINPISSVNDLKSREEGVDIYKDVEFWKNKINGSGTYGDKRLSYWYQNMGKVSKYENTYEQNILPWHSAEVFWGNAAGVIGQSIQQMTIAALTKSPSASLAYGSLMSASAVDEIMKENNVPLEERLAMFTLAAGITYGSEQLLMKIGLSPILKNFGKEAKTKKALIQMLGQEVKSKTGIEFGSLATSTTKSKNYFLNVFKKSYWSKINNNNLHTFRGSVKDMFKEGLGEIAQENLEDISNEFMFTLYDYINKDKILSSRSDKDTIEEDRLKFMTNYDVRRNAITNWWNNIAVGEKILQTSLLSFLGGFSGGVVGSSIQAIQKLGDKSKQQSDIVGMVEVFKNANWDKNTVLNEGKKLFEQGGFNITHYGVTEEGNAKPVTDPNVKKTFNDVSYEAFVQTVNATDQIIKQFGLNRLKEQGAIGDDITFIGDAIDVFKNMMGKELELNVQKEELSTLKDKTEIENKQKTINTLQEEYDKLRTELSEYTTPDNLNNGINNKLSKKARELIMSYHLAHAELLLDIDKNKGTWERIFKENNIRSKKDKDNFIKKQSLLTSRQSFINGATPMLKYNAINFLLEHTLMSDGIVGNKKSKSINSYKAISEALNKIMDIESLSKLSNDLNVPKAPDDKLPNIKDLSSKIVDVMSKFNGVDDLIDAYNQESYGEKNANLEEGQEPIELTEEEKQLNIDAIYKERGITEKDVKLRSDIDNMINSLSDILDIGISDKNNNISNLIIKKLAKDYKGKRLYIDTSTEEGQNILSLLNDTISDFENKRNKGIKSKDNKSTSKSVFNYNVEGLNVVEFNSNNSGVSEILLSDMLLLIDNLEDNLYLKDKNGNFILKDGNKIVDTNDQIKFDVANSYLNALYHYEMLYESLSLKNRVINNIDKSILKHRDTKEKERTYNEDIEATNSEKNANLSAMQAISENIIPMLDNIKSNIESGAKLFNDKSDMARTRQIVFAVELWGNLLIDENGEPMPIIKETLEHKSVGINIRNRLTELKKIYDELLKLQKKDESVLTKIPDTIRGQINNILFSIEHDIYNTIKNGTQEAKDKIHQFFASQLENQFEIINSNGDSNPKSSQVNKGYFGNLKIINIVDPNIQGLSQFGTNMQISNNDGTYNGVYHWMVNYFHRILNSDSLEISDSIKSTVDTIAYDKDIKENKTSDDLYLPSAEQLFVLYDMLNISGSDNMDMFIFEQNEKIFKDAIGLKDADNNVISLQEAEKLLPTLNGQAHISLNNAIEEYKARTYAKIDLGGRKGLINNGIMVTGNAGSGKTFLTGYGIISFAKHNGFTGDKVLKLKITAPDNDTNGLTSNIKKIVEQYLKYYNDNTAEAKNKINIQIEMSKASDILSSKDTNMNADLVVFDEAGRLNNANTEIISNIASKNKNTSFWFLGDSQQIPSDLQHNQFYLPMQVRMVNTIPIQHVFRTGNSEVEALASYFSSSALILQRLGAQIGTMPTLYLDKNGDEYNGGKYYKDANSVIKEYFKRSKKIGKKAALVFIDQKQYEAYKKENSLLDSSKNDNLNIFILFNDISNEKGLKTIQGKEYDEIYLVSESEDMFKNKHNRTVFNMILMSAFYTGTTRAKKFIGLIGDEKLNRKDKEGYINKRIYTTDELNKAKQTNKSIINNELKIDKQLLNLDPQPLTLTAKDSNTPKQISENIESNEIIDEETYIEDNDNGSTIVYLDENNNEIITKQLGLKEIGGEINIVTENGNIPLNKKINNLEEYYNEKDAEEENKTKNKEEINIEKNNFPVLQGSISNDEYISFSSLQRMTNTFLGSYKNAKIQIMSSILNMIHKSNINNKYDIVKDINKPIFKIIKLNDKSYVGPTRKNGKLEIGKLDIKFSPLAIMVNLNNINLSVLGLSDEIKQSLIDNSDINGYIQISYFAPLKTNEFSDFESKHVGNGIEYTLSELSEQIHTEGEYLIYERNRTENGTDMWNVPGTLFNTTERIVSFGDTSTHFRVQLEGGNSVTMDTMTFLETYLNNEIFQSKLRGDIDEILSIQDNTDINDTMAERLADNDVVRAMKISSNKAIITEAINLTDSTLLNKKLSLTQQLNTIKKFAQYLNDILENKEYDKLNQLYVSPYVNNEISLSRLKAGSHLGINTFFKNLKQNTEEDIKKNTNLQDSYDDDGMFMKEEQFVPIVLDDNLSNTYISLMGEKEFAAIKFVDDLSEFGNSVVGLLNNAEIKILSKNGYIHKDVIQHELFHKVLRHGINKKSYFKILDDFRNMDIDNREDLSYNELEELAARDFQSKRGKEIEQSPKGLWNKLIDFIRRLSDNIYQYLTGYRDINTYNQLVNNIFDSKYADRLNLNLDSNIEPAFLDFEFSPFKDDIQSDLDFSLDETSNYKDIVRINNMFNSLSERNMMIRYTSNLLLNQTIFSQKNSTSVSSGNKISIEYAIDDMLSDFESTINNEINDDSWFIRDGIDMRKISPSEMNNILRKYEHSLRPELMLDYLYSKVIGESDINDVISLVDDFKFFLDSVHKNTNKSNAKNIQYADSGLITIDQLTPFNLKQILDSIVMREFDVTGDKKFNNGKFTAGNIPISKKTYDIIREEMSKQYSLGNLNFEDNILESIESFSNILKTLAEKHIIFNNESKNISSVSNQIQTLYEYFYSSPNSIYNKILNSNNDEVKQELENMFVAFTVVFKSITKRLPSYIGKRGLVQKGLNDIDTYKKKIEGNIKNKLFSQGTNYKEWVLSSFAELDVNNKYKIDINGDVLSIKVNGNNFININLENNIIKDISFVNEFNYDVANSITKILKDFGVYTNSMSLQYFYDNKELFRDTVNRVVKNQNIDSFFPLYIAGNIMSVYIGATSQYSHNLIDGLSSLNKDISESDFEEFRSNIKNIFDNITQNAFVGVKDNKNDEYIKEDLDRQYTALKDALNQAKLKKIISEETLLKLSTLSQKLILPIQSYNSLIKSFNGYNFIKDDIDMLDIDNNEKDEINEIITSITPSPLNFDFALDVLHNLTETVYASPNTEYNANGTKRQLITEAGNANAIIDRFINTNPETRNSQIKKANIDINIAIDEGFLPSTKYNSILNGKLTVLKRIEVSEIKHNGMSDTDADPIDLFVKQLDAIYEGMLKGETYISESIKGDNNKIFMYIIDKKLRTKELISNNNNVSDNNPVSRQLRDVLEIIKDNFMTYHVEHIKSVRNFINAFNQLVDTLNLDENTSVDLKTKLIFLNSIVSGNNVMSKDFVRQYDFESTLRIINDIIDSVNKNSSDINLTYNTLLNLGLANTLDISLSNSKLIAGNALSFNRYITKEGDSKVSYNRSKDSYNGFTMYKNYKNTESIIDFNPKTMGEAFNLINKMFGQSMFALQNKINKLIKNNEFNEDTLSMFKVGNKNVVFYDYVKDNTIKNWNMIEYFLYDHVTKFATSHLMFGHELWYKDSEDFYNRNKIFFTPGKNCMATPNGLNKTYKVAVLQDSNLEQLVQQYLSNNKSSNATFNSIKKIIDTTDGQTFDTYIGRHFLLKSLGDNYSGYDSNTLKPIYADYDIGRGEMLMKKDSQKKINRNDININEDLIFLEYAALKNLDTELADLFISKYNSIKDIEIDYGTAFEKACDFIIDKINNKRKNNMQYMDNIILSFTHPSAMKKGRLKINNISLNNIDGTSNLQAMGEFPLSVIELKTDKLRQVFNPNSKIDGSEGEVLAKQAFFAVKGILNEEQSSRLDDVLSGVIGAKMNEIGMNKDGSISNNKKNTLITTMIEKTITGVNETQQTGTTIDLLNKSLSNENLLQLPNVNFKIIQSLSKEIINNSAGIKFKGGSYNQISDANVFVNDVTIKYNDGRTTNITVTSNGLKKLQNMFGKDVSIEISEKRMLNPMNNKNNKLNKGEAILQTTSQYEYGITQEHSLVDALFIKVNDEYININDIDKDGIYNGKRIIDTGSNIKGLNNSIILQSKQRAKFKNDLEMLNSFKKSLNILLFRKPTSLLTSGGTYNVIELRHGDNDVIVSSRKNAWDDSDFDIDKLYSYEYSDDNNSDEILDIYNEAFNELSSNDLLNVSIETKSLDKLSDEYINTIGTPNTMHSSFEAQQRSYMGNETISRFANAIITSSILGQISNMSEENRNLIYNKEYNGDFNDSKELLDKIINNPTQYQFYVQLAIMLQAAVDNTKEAKLGKLGISKYSTNEIVAMLYDGFTVSEVIDFLKNPIIKEIYSDIENASVMTGKKDIETVSILLADMGLRLTKGKSIRIPIEEETLRKANELVGEKRQLTDEELNNFTEEKGVVQEMSVKDIGLAMMSKKKSIDKKHFDNLNKNLNDTSIDKMTEEQIEKRQKEQNALIEEDIDYNKFNKEVRQFALNLLQKYSMVGDILKEITFVSDILDGVKTKEHQQSNMNFLIEKQFGKSLDSLDFTDNGFISLQHTDSVLKNLIDYDKQYNDYYKRLDVNLKDAYVGIRNNMNNMFKVGNIFAVSSLFRTYARIHQFKNNIVSNSFISHNKEFEDDYITRAKLLNNIGKYTNPKRYYEFNNALNKTLLSRAIDRLVESGELFDNAELGGKSINLSSVETNNGILIVDDMNTTYDSIDITNIHNGRQLFIKRIPSYIQNLSDLLDKYYTGLNSNIDVSIIKSHLRTKYMMSDFDIDTLYENMKLNNGDTFFKYIDRYGSEFNSILIIKNSNTLKENPELQNRIIDLFGKLPSRIKNILSLYELIINGFNVRGNSLYDIVGSNIFEKISPYMSDINDLKNNLNFKIFFDNVSTQDGILYPIVRENNNSILSEVKSNIENFGIDDNKYAYVKVKVNKENTINNQRYLIKRINLDEINNDSNFDNVGNIVFNNVLKNALPYSTHEIVTSNLRNIKNLNEKNIHELKEKGYTSIQLYNKHNYKDSDRVKNNINIPYITNSGDTVIISSIGDRYIRIKQTDNPLYSLDKIKSEQKAKNINRMDINEFKESLITISDKLKELFIAMENEPYYYNEDLKLKAIRVSNIVSNDEYNFKDEDHKTVVLSDGNVADIISKRIFNAFLNKGLTEDMFYKYMKEASPIENKFVLEFIETVSNNYKELEDETKHPLYEYLGNDRMIAEIGKEYILRIMNSNVMNKINQLKAESNDIFVITDLRLAKVFDNNILMGESDIAVFKKINNKWNVSIIDTKTSNLSYEGTRAKVFNQIATYSNMVLSNNKGLMPSNNYMFHIDKLSNFVENLTIENGIVKSEVAQSAKIEVEKRYSKDMKEHISNLDNNIKDKGVKINNDGINTIKNIQLMLGIIKNTEC